MIVVEYPKPQFRTKEHEGRTYIFDNIRKTWLLLTPEEWVRQNFVQYLVLVKQYPVSLIALEKEVMVNEMKKRFDILVYDKQHQPWMLVECKAENIILNQPVLEQVLRYNITLPVPYLVITNGKETRGWKKEGGQLIPLTELPEFG